MDICKWADKKAKKMDAWDMAFTKMAVFFFALMVVALVPQVASLEWHFYAIGWIVFAIPPMRKICNK